MVIWSIGTCLTEQEKNNVPYFDCGIKMEHFYQATYSLNSLGKTWFTSESEANEALKKFNEGGEVKG
jgi:hypothetical protein